MLKLYIGNKNYSSWSPRPWVLMRALGIPIEERLKPVSEGSNWDRFRTFSEVNSSKFDLYIKPNQHRIREAAKFH